MLNSSFFVIKLLTAATIWIQFFASAGMIGFSVFSPHLLANPIEAAKTRQGHHTVNDPGNIGGRLHRTPSWC